MLTYVTTHSRTADMQYIPKDKLLILFDGVCDLCNGFVRFVIDRDAQDVFRFASLQSDIGQQFIKNKNLDPSKTDTIILVTANGDYNIKSTAVLKIVKRFGGLWSLAQLLWLLPVFIRNLAYDFVAKNRYKWFGKKDSCMIPTEELKAKFIA